MVAGLRLFSGTSGRAEYAEAELLVVLGCGHHRAAGCLHPQGCPLAAAWRGWGAATSISYPKLLQSPRGMALSHQVGFLQREGYLISAALRWFRPQRAHLSISYHTKCVLALVHCQQLRQQSHPSRKTVACAP